MLLQKGTKTTRIKTTKREAKGRMKGNCRNKLGSLDRASWARQLGVSYQSAMRPKGARPQSLPISHSPTAESFPSFIFIYNSIYLLYN